MPPKDGANYSRSGAHCRPLTHGDDCRLHLRAEGKLTDLVKPLIYLQNNALFTMPCASRPSWISSQGGEGPEVVMAATVILTIPMIIIFFLASATIEGLTTTGMKARLF